MKITLLASAILALGLSSIHAEEPARSSLAPTGKLTIHRTLVRTGIKPMLNWDIEYPVSVKDVITIGSDGQIITTKRTLMEVRVVGAAFQIGSDHPNLEFKSSIGGSSWQRLFYGNDSEPRPNEPVLSQVVNADTRIDFSARASDGNGGWYATRDTKGQYSSSLQALTNGDSVPQFVPAYNQNTAENFLAQYISDQDQVTIDPRDVIYLVELYATDPTSSYFDMQDIVMVVSFKDTP